MKNYLRNHIGDIVYIFVVIIPAIIALKVVINGEIPFWYDPARDLLLAAENLKKVTLIGPPSGITGIFYGPYWIWLLSGGLLISKNPRVVDFFVLTVPYFVIFPFVLYKFSPIFKKGVIISLWILFISSFSFYATQIWNPHLAPLFILISIYLLVLTPFDVLSIKNMLRIGMGGFFAGLVLHFHISFGVVFISGSYLFIILDMLQVIFSRRNNRWTTIKRFMTIFIAFSLGVAASFLPYLLFEYRHGFAQTNVLIKTLTNPNAVVGIQGLSHIEIITYFFGKFAAILHLPVLLATSIVLLGILIFSIQWQRKQLTVSAKEKKTMLYVAAIICMLFLIYLRTKNPVWGYHFTAVEIILLLVLGLIINAVSFLRKLTYLWVGVIFIGSIYSFYSSLGTNIYTVSSLATKERVTQTILQERSPQFAVASYNQSIYTYEYDYLFAWLGKKELAHTPTDLGDVKIVYLIIEKTENGKRNNFVMYFTPGKQFTTTKTWKMPDGTEILKRERSIQGK